MVRNLVTKVRPDQYQEEYNPDFVNKWDELIDWEKRYEAEGGFFKTELEKHGVKTVLDIACGTGFHTVTLSLDGFDVVGADGAATMLAKARENADRCGLSHIKFA